MVDKRMFTRIYATSALAGGLILAGATVATASTGVPAAGGTASVTVTVTPHTGLKSGQTVKVAGSGLVAHRAYHVGECAKVSSGYVCDVADHVDRTASAQGKVSTALTVRASYKAPTASGGTTTINCKTKTCVAGVFSKAGDDVGSVPISFVSGG
jgi:hypothetical protein